MQVFEFKRLGLPAAGIAVQLRRNLRLPWPMTPTKTLTARRLQRWMRLPDQVADWQTADRCRQHCRAAPAADCPA